MFLYHNNLLDFVALKNRYEEEVLFFFPKFYCGRLTLTEYGDSNNVKANRNIKCLTLHAQRSSYCENKLVGGFNFIVNIHS